MPIWVVSPPSRQPNDKGISKREGGTRARRASPITTGSMSTATPMLFINAESPPEASMITATSAASLRPEIRSTLRPIRSPAPVRSSPSLMMNMAQSVMTASLLKPATASAGVTRPVMVRAPTTSSATISMRSASVTNSTTAITRIVITSAMSNISEYLGPRRNRRRPAFQVRRDRQPLHWSCRGRTFA